MSTKQVTVIDEATGEVLESTLTTVKKVNSDEFIQVYLEDIAGLMKISNKSEIQVLIWLWKYSSFAEEDQIGNLTRTDSYVLDVISDKTGYTKGSIRNTITSLKRKNILITDGKYSNALFLNPTYFFKGSLRDRASCYKKVMEYKIID